jgi:hypothetical protein
MSFQTRSSNTPSPVNFPCQRNLSGLFSVAGFIRMPDQLYIILCRLKNRAWSFTCCDLFSIPKP